MDILVVSTFLAIMNNEHLCIYLRGNTFAWGEGYILRRWAVGSYGSCMLNPLRDLQIPFQSSYNILHFHRLSIDMWLPMGTYMIGSSRLTVVVDNFVYIFSCLVGLFQ